MMRTLFLLKRAASSPAVVACLRVALGVVLIVASLDKIQHPEAFAQSIANYRILPYPFIHALAIFLPWLEIVTGGLLVLGMWTEASAALACGMLFVFILAISQALVRNLDISCGCFDTDPGAHRMTRWTLYWDVIWLAWAVLVFLFDRGRYSVAALLRGNLRGD